MAKSAEEARKAIQKVYPTLLKLLPIGALVEHFYSLQLLSYERKSKLDSLTSPKEKITYFLDEMLIPGLSINYTRHFDEMIAMMKESDDDLTRFLVEKLTPPDHTAPIAAEIAASSIPSIASATTVTTDTESAPVEFSTDQRMENAFAKLLKKFVREFSRPPPYGPSLGEVKVLCINYCESHHHEKCDFTTSVSSMDDLFSKLADPLYCNFLNLELLEYLAESVDNECLKTSIRNYNDTFCNVKIKNELDNMVEYKVKAIRSGLRTKKYEMMFIKLIRKGITYGQVKQIKVKISHKVIFVPPNSLIVKWCRKGCICLGWLIPSCLVDAAYHSACTNIAVFAQLGIKYLIIGNYKIEPPALPNKEIPMGLFCKHYQTLVQRLHPVKVSEYMFSKGLLSKRDYTVITNAPCDRIRNCMIIEYVRHQSSSYLFIFLDVLHKIEDQSYLYSILINALQSNGFFNLADDYDITRDDDEDDDNDGQMSIHPFLDQYVKDYLKLNLSVKNKTQLLLPDCKESKSPDINIQYLCLIDSLCKLMESCDPGVFIDKCASLMTSYIYNIPLFSDETLKDYDGYHNVSVMLRYLMCYFSWCDLSVVLKLLEICDYPKGVRLLQKFKHQIDFTKPITEYPIFTVDSLMIPSESSPYTVMAIHYELEHFSLSLRNIEMLKSLITEKYEISFISCQFLGISNNSQVFHWLIPKSVAALIVSKVRESYNYLLKNGIKKLFIYPIFSIEISLFAATVSTDSNADAYQQELDEIKLKCNILYEENTDLKSQLDTVRMQSNRKLIEKYRELKDEGKHDTVILAYQQELDETKLKCNLLYEEINELKFQLDRVDKQSNTKLTEKYNELEDKVKLDPDLKSDEAKDDESISHQGGQEHISEHSQATVQSAVENEYQNVWFSESESESEDDFGNVHMIELNKGSHKLGIKIKKFSVDNKDLGIFVDAMEPEGFAAASQKLQIDDRILACNGCDFTKLPSQTAEDYFKEIMDEPLLRMAVSRGYQYAASGEGSGVSDYHHGDGNSTVDGSDPVANTQEFSVIHDIRIMKGSQGLGLRIISDDCTTETVGSQPPYIENITKDGPGFKDGRLQSGDLLLKVNGISVEQMTQAQVVGLIRSLPEGSVHLQVSCQETCLSNDDAISVLEVSTAEDSNETAASNVGVGSGRTVMTFDIAKHQSYTNRLGVTVHGRMRRNSPSKDVDMGIYVKSIVSKGLVAMDGRVQPGDQVLLVNGHNLLGRSNSDAMSALKKAMDDINPNTKSIQLVIGRKTAAVPMQLPSTSIAAVANDDQQALIKQYMDKVEMIINVEKISSRIKCLLQDVVELINSQHMIAAGGTSTIPPTRMPTLLEGVPHLADVSDILQQQQQHHTPSASTKQPKIVDPETTEVDTIKLKATSSSSPAHSTPK